MRSWARWSVMLVVLALTGCASTAYRACNVSSAGPWTLQRHPPAQALALREPLRRTGISAGDDAQARAYWFADGPDRLLLCIKGPGPGACFSDLTEFTRRDGKFVTDRPPGTVTGIMCTQ